MALCTTDEVKTHIFGSTTGSKYDTLIAQLILQVEGDIAKRTGVITDATVATTIADEILDSAGDLEIQVKNHPIDSLVKLESRNSDGSWTEYTQETIGNVEFEGDRIYSLYVVAPKGRRQIRVNYTAGYLTASVPADLKKAAILMVLDLFNKRNMTGLSAQTALNVTMQVTDVELAQVERTLANYSQMYAL